jgi:signal transduction histidine kinase
MNVIRKYLFLLLAVGFLIPALISEHTLLKGHPEKKLIARFQLALHRQEVKLNSYLDSIEEIVCQDSVEMNYASVLSGLNRLYDKDGLGFLVFKGRELVFWSDNSFSFAAGVFNQNGEEGLLTLSNGIFLEKRRVCHNKLTLVGLIRLKNNYSYENQYLINEFVFPFDLPSGFKIVSESREGAYPINNLQGEQVFSIFPEGEVHCNYAQLYWPVSLYVVAIVMLLLFVCRQFREKRDEPFILKMVVLAAVLFAGYWVHILFGIPSVFRELDFFGPKYYAVSDWLPSLGDFFIIAVLFFVWSVLFVEELSRLEIREKSQIIAAYIFSGLLYQIAGLLINNLVLNSNISFKLYQIDDIDNYSFSSYLAIALILYSIFQINLKVIDRTEQFIRRRRFLIIHFWAFVFFVVLTFVFRGPYFFLVLLFLMVNMLHQAISELQIKRLSLSYMILFIALFAVSTLLLVYRSVKQRDIQTQRLKAITLSSEHDPVAEVFLHQVQQRFNVDSVIPSLLSPPYADLENYLTRNYFNGYFRKFDVQYIICTGADSVQINSGDRWEPCFPYFDEMIRKSGNKIPGTNFYYIDNMNGRVTYFGQLHYPLSIEANGISVFIELSSRSISEGIGFPELLMEKSMIKPQRYKYLSYAKYYNNELVNRSGDYPYNYYIHSYRVDARDDEFVLRSWDGYNHLIHNLGQNNYIIVSSRMITFGDYLISFPYLFVFFFLFVLTVVFFGNSSFRRLALSRDLRFKIQASIISVVLVSLLFVASGTIFYNIQEYKSRHQEDLNEKMKSISEEIQMRLMDVERVTPEIQSWLYDELVRMSNIFRTDINIYGSNGELVATSRPEILQRGILSPQMDAEAYYELSENFQTNYVQPENIGKLSYLSAYEPILNSRGEYLGFLNLPYFIREDELKQEISTFIVAFINLYVLLFLASVIVALLLSNQITRPLSLIRDKLSSIQLGKKNEPINYKGQDEIGSLVKEYNRKVEELAESAELLARSERESAWREMAKQIAHEIKNPLTPMKLNIQYLQKAKEEGSEHYDEFFKRVTKTLIEQIDTLSEIATEFSNFAKIPTAKNEVFNLVDILEKISDLFEPTKKVRFVLERNGLRNVPVFADKEQFSRAILNLVKNAIQAIPVNRKGEVKVKLECDGAKAVVAVADNGSGISDELREQLFQPNFTTKTSGMGLGLAIVKNIVDNFGGNIWYETELQKGTTFYVEIPVCDSGTVN